ncbi:Barwin-like endoglucanase [Glarea lozoyensis ATCC 20868]|uniref:Barwin-like endoglucanase n=1 Tax=Glarea lozoyensis (strain ATCC 20868 / MF5171) TaxID=1116229 RepID=S3DHK5_GLAL2|nr:Barwin-like endoglucanase [Glarea lozoyensis ATCC 20868]EPE31521.1 Barwin-like endoglucanase [Glarea lozoyensis ATCC 20868]
MQFLTPTILLTLLTTLAAAAPGTTPNLPRALVSGTATWYNQNGEFGSCGEVHSDSEILCAVPPSRISGKCGHTCVLNANGHTLRGRVVHTCVFCSATQIDLSVGAFKVLSNNNLAVGTISLTWQVY